MILVLKMTKKYHIWQGPPPQLFYSYIYVSSASEIIEWPCDVDHETGVARNHIFQKN